MGHAPFGQRMQQQQQKNEHDIPFFYVEWLEITQYHYHCLPDGALNTYDGNFVDQTIQQQNNQPEN